jgi:hypothetical protein
MGVASCRSISLLSNVVFNHAFVSSHCRIRFAFGFRSVVVRVVGFWPATRPSPAQPGPRAPGALPLPHARAPSLLFLSLIQFSRAATSSPPPLSLLRDALGFGDGDHQIWIPVVSSPPPPSLSLPFLFFLLSPTRAPSLDHVPRALTRSCPTPPPLAAPPSASPSHALLAAPPACLLGRARTASLARPRATVMPPSCVPSRHAPLPRSMAVVPWPRAPWPRYPCRAPSRRALGHTGSSSKQRLNFSSISFKFSLMNMLRRALHRATNEFNFRFISVLHRATSWVNFGYLACCITRFTARRFI